jgi:4-amino-4-deoxy-L-arabinose transferase-like glycosyltransferase
MWVNYKIFLFIFIFLFLNLVIYIEVVPLFHEEPRRALIAQEMLLSKNFVKPTVMGEPYFKKPPLHNWLIASTSLKDMVVSNFNARLPSIFAFVLLGLLLLSLPIDRQTAIKASLFALSSYVILFSYANKAEPDMLFTFLIFASYYFYIIKPKNTLYVIMSSLFMGASILTKGISPLLFYPPIVFYIAFSAKFNHHLTNKTLRKQDLRDSKKREFQGLLLHLFLSLIPPLVWLLILSFQINMYDFFKTASLEIFHRGQGDLKVYVYHLISYPFRIIAATLPFSLVLFFAFKKNSEPDRFYLSAVYIFIWIFLLFLLSPAGCGRYFMPAIPFFAIIAAYHINGEKMFDINIRRILLFIFSIAFIVAIPVYLLKGFFIQVVIFMVALAFLYYYFKKPPQDVIKETLILLMIFVIGYFHGYYFYKSEKPYKYDKITEIDKLKEEKSIPVFFDKSLKYNLKLALYLERKMKKIVFAGNNSIYKDYYYFTDNQVYPCKNITTLDIPDKKNKYIYIYLCSK